VVPETFLLTLGDDEICRRHDLIERLLLKPDVTIASGNFIGLLVVGIGVRCCG
jgi:hypothetical protein